MSGNVVDAGPQEKFRIDAVAKGPVHSVVGAVEPRLRMLPFRRFRMGRASGTLVIERVAA
jgi:hypothetical protein